MRAGENAQPPNGAFHSMCVWLEAHTETAVEQKQLSKAMSSGQVLGNFPSHVEKYETSKSLIKGPT